MCGEAQVSKRPPNVADYVSQCLCEQHAAVCGWTLWYVSECSRCAQHVNMFLFTPFVCLVVVLEDSSEQSEDQLELLTIKMRTFGQS